MSDEQMRCYQRRRNTTVTAVKLDLETEGFTFKKWGAMQFCRSGDWLISSKNDCYTVANSSFRRTYREVSPGRFEKHTKIRARKATTAGKIPTLEGETTYSSGDYLVENDENGSDVYAISDQKFHELYELVDDHDN